MSIVLLQVEGQPYVVAVNAGHIDAGEDPDVLSDYLAAVLEHLLVRDVTSEPQVRFCLVDVASVAEYGPNEIARFLTDYGPTDLPQTWETVR